MKWPLLLQILLLISIEVSAKVRLFSPGKNTVLAGQRLPIEIRGCKKQLKMWIHHKNHKEELYFSPSPRKGNWFSTYQLTSTEKTTLIFEGYCKKRSLYFERNITVSQLPSHKIVLPLAQEMMKRSSSKRKWAWTDAILLYGMSRLNRIDDQSEEIINYLKDYLQHYTHKIHKIKINRADNCPSALSAAYLRRKLKIEEGKDLEDKVADYIKTTKRNAINSLDHVGVHPFYSLFVPSSIWLDSLMMWVVFAVKYALDNFDEDLLNFALDQPGVFARYLQDEKTGLFKHMWAVKSEKSVPSGDHFWLRGNGWVAASIAEILAEIGPYHPRYNEIAGIFLKLIDGIKKWQLPNGLWSTLITDQTSYAENSGPSLFAFAMAKGHQIGLLPKEDLFNAKRIFQTITAQISYKKGHVYLPDISAETNAGPALFYKWVLKEKNKSYGVGAYFLLASALSKETFP